MQITKRKLMAIVITFVLCIMLCSCSWSVFRLPEYGVWYCEELKISLNFGVDSFGEEAGYITLDDGNIKKVMYDLSVARNNVLICYYDEDKIIYSENIICRGEGKYHDTKTGKKSYRYNEKKDNENRLEFLLCTNDGKEYVFKKVLSSE